MIDWIFCSKTLGLYFGANLELENPIFNHLKILTCHSWHEVTHHWVINNHWHELAASKGLGPTLIVTPTPRRRDQSTVPKFTVNSHRKYPPELYRSREEKGRNLSLAFPSFLRRRQFLATTRVNKKFNTQRHKKINNK